MPFFKHFISIFKKEFKVYFNSPIAYIIIALFLLASGFIFFEINLFFYVNQAQMRDFFTLLPFIMAVLVPAITMRLLAEEINLGSYELLVTLPVTFMDVIVGKFLAALAFVGIMLLPTVSYAVSIAFLGKLDIGPVLGGYIGALFLGAAYCSVGLFASSLTKNQIISFIITLAVCLFLSSVDMILFFLPPELLSLFQFISANYHFQNIAKGLVDTRDVLYFASVTFIALSAARISMQEKK